MKVKYLIKELQECVETWPDVLEMNVTFEGQDFDLVIPVNPMGQGPLIKSSDAIGGVYLTDSGFSVYDHKPVTYKEE